MFLYNQRALKTLLYDPILKLLFYNVIFQINFTFSCTCRVSLVHNYAALKACVHFKQKLKGYVVSVSYLIFSNHILHLNNSDDALSKMYIFSIILAPAILPFAICTSDVQQSADTVFLPTLFPLTNFLQCHTHYPTSLHLYNIILIILWYKA